MVESLPSMHQASASAPKMCKNQQEAAQGMCEQPNAYEGLEHLWTWVSTGGSPSLSPVDTTGRLFIFHQVFSVFKIKQPHHTYT